MYICIFNNTGEEKQLFVRCLHTMYLKHSSNKNLSILKNWVGNSLDWDTLFITADSLHIRRSLVGNEFQNESCKSFRGVDNAPSFSIEMAQSLFNSQVLGQGLYD